MRVSRRAGLLAAVAVGASVVALPKGPPSERGLENLAAFTQLLGYVRFFHPSDEAAATNWDQFAAKAVAEVEGARNARELAATLAELFRPIAPTLRVFPSDGAPATSGSPPKPGGIAKPRLTAWRHAGVRLMPGGPYSSVRIGLDQDPSRQAFGNLMRSLPAEPYRGKRVRYRAALRAEVSGDGNQAQLWLRVDR
ncbi:MAG: peptidase S41, partial [bacterium]|nr:peptidase S41 [bacterium]